MHLWLFENPTPNFCIQLAISLFKMVGFAVGTATKKQDLAVAQAEAPQLAKVKWWADPGMRVLYFYAAILCVCSATTGYDG